MRYVLPLCLAVAAPLPAAAQGSRADEAPLVLATVTCAQVMASGARGQRSLVALSLGARTARAGGARFSIPAIDAAEQAVREACTADGAADRRLSAITEALPPAPAAEGDLDLTSLTCMGLAPVWRQAARSLVPFMVGWRDAASDAPLTRTTLDSVGEGLPRICRDEANRDRKVADIIGTLR